MRRSLVLIPLVLAACAKQRGPENQPGNLVTVCVENAVTGYGNVMAIIERTRIEVPLGRTICRRVYAASTSARMTASMVGGDGEGRIHFANILPSASGGCWRWRLSGAQGAQGGDILPCREGEGL